jgi:cell division protein FtsW
MTARSSQAPLDDPTAPDWVDGALRQDRPSSRDSATAITAAGDATDGAARRAFPTTPMAGRLLLFATIALLLFGLVMAYSASTAQGYFSFGSSWYFLKKQLLFAGAGVVVMIVLSRVDYRLWRRFAFPLAVAVAALLVVVALPGVGATINGARRWLDLGFASVQPSEFAKPAAVLLAAAMAVGGGARLTTFKGFARIIAVALLPLAGLIMIGKDLSTTAVLTLAVGAVLVTAGAR